jgi:hypothetical protein
MTDLMLRMKGRNWSGYCCDVLISLLQQHAMVKDHFFQKDQDRNQITDQKPSKNNYAMHQYN